MFRFPKSEGFMCRKLAQLYRITVLAAVVMLWPVRNVCGHYNASHLHFTVDNGLPATDIYHVYQDSKGYIWFATNHGVSRFDGYTFENFDVVSGLTDNIVFEIFEDYKHRIWFIPYSAKLSYYYNGKIYQYQYNDKISDVILQSRGPVKTSFYVDTLDNVYLGLKNYGILTISPEGIYRRIEDGEQSGMNVLGVDNHLLFANFSGGTSYLSLNIHGSPLRFPFSDFGLKRKAPVYYYFIRQSDSRMILSLDEYLTVMGASGKVVETRTFNSPIIWMSIDSQNSLWVALFNGGVYRFKDCNLHDPAALFVLPNQQVTSVISDGEGGNWFTTLNDGVYYFPDIDIRVYDKSVGLSDNRVNTVFADSKYIYAGFEVGFVDVIEHDRVEHHKLKQPNNARTFMRYIYGDTLTGRVWVATFNTLGYFIGNRYYPIFDEKELSYPRRIIPSSKGGYWIGTAKGIQRIQNDRVVYDSRDEGFSAMVLSMTEDADGTLWFSTVNGLWKYANRIYQYMGENNEYLSKQCRAMFYNRLDSTIWLGTNGLGVVIFHRNDSIITHISKEDGLPSNSIQAFYVHDNRVWVGTQQGVAVIPLDQSSRLPLLRITKFDGLPTNEVNEIFLRDTIVYLATSRGLALINLKTLSSVSAPPPVVLLNYTIDGEQYAVNDSVITIDYSRNLLTFSYVGLAYRNMGKVLYRYRLLGLDSNWVYTHNTSCSFSNLQSGNFTLEVEAQNSKGAWSSSGAKISIVVNPPYWERFWFIALITVLLSSLLYFIYTLRVREINRRNELMNNINIYKQQSLRQQMNPHFIFNTLNSIQYYILERDTISSHKYLTKFARLMRLTLDNSQSPTIPLRDELDALRLYLDLESLRLEGKFSYTIDFGSNDSILEFKVPTLMIQPFVENAIWHGIMLKPDKSGHVQIQLKEYDDYVLCTIQDNGVGRDEARRIRQANTPGHRSRGFQITQQRIDLLNSMYGQRFNIKVTDLFDSKGKPLGTLVSITIPKTFSP